MDDTAEEDTVDACAQVMLTLAARTGMPMELAARAFARAASSLDDEHDLVLVCELLRARRHLTGTGVRS